MDPFDQAIQFINRKEYRAGRNIFEKLLDNSDGPNKQTILFNVAACYALEEEYQQSLNIMNDLIVRDNDYDLRFNKAMCEFQSTHCKDVYEFYRQLNQLFGALLEAKMDIDTEQVRSKIVAEMSTLLWNFSLYQTLETVLLKAKPLVSPGNKAWTQSLAHTLFMMDNRYDESCELYLQLLPSESNQQQDLLSVDQYVLANLCVSLVLTGRNNEAEQLIKEVQEDEDKLSDELDYNLDDSNRKLKISHLDMINLAIGTLYCVKNNQEFGLIRLFKTFEPFDDKRQRRDNYPMKWFHAKRCILSLLDMHCKQMIYVKDEVFDMMITFLKQCERYGLSISTLHHGNNELVPTKNLSIEARYLRSIVVKMFHDS